MKRMLRLSWLLALCLCGMARAEGPPPQFEVEVEGEVLTISHFPAEGDSLILWVAPGYGDHSRMRPVARELAAAGIEVWHLDLAESLFLTKSTNTLREMDGRYVAALIEQARERTGKRITLLSRSYGAIPLLRGARLWQQRHQQDAPAPDYLNGAILFTPELYSEIPALGLPPVYDPIVDATTIPLMVYQAGNRNNRMQFDELVTRLQQGGAQVYTKLVPGVVGIFYEEDKAPATLAAWQGIAPHIKRMSTLLAATPTPLYTRELAATPEPASKTLDIRLKPFNGNPIPPPLDLPDATGRQVRHADYKGRVTVVNFWATWCGPCVEEIPSLNRLRQRMAGKPFELVSVDYLETTERVRAFMTDVAVDFPVLMDSDGTVSQSWGVLVFPSTFVIGPDGRIAYGINGAILWDSDEVVAQLEALLKP